MIDIPYEADRKIDEGDDELGTDVGEGETHDQIIS